MSDVDIAQTGAIAAPVENTAPTQEQTQATPQESAPAESPEDEQARDEKGRFVQKRINELTRRYHDESRARSALEQEVQQLREQFSRATQPAPPDISEDPAGYFAHIAREEARQYIESERSVSAQQQEQQRMGSIVQEYSSREQAYVAQHPDYEEAVEAFLSVVGPNRSLGEVLMTSDHGPAVAHYLGQHLDEAAHIARLPAHLAAAAVARLEAKVSAPKPKPVSAAPAPAPTVTGASVNPRGTSDGQSIEEWMRERNTQR